MPISKSQFDRAMRSEARFEDRVAAFGAMLAKASRLGDRLVIVGGSAISIYTSGVYISKDIDIVGPRSRISPILRSWGFRLDAKGERPYWIREDLGFLVDLTGRRRYIGLESHVTRIDTRFGPIRLAAVEDLVLRRLVFAKRDRRVENIDEAVLVFDQHRDGFDLDYLEGMVKYERVGDAYAEFRRRAGL
jgi:hypothetical protein